MGAGKDSRDLVRDRLQEQRRKQLEAAYQEAASDPTFMHEMCTFDIEWDITSGDGLGVEFPG